MLHILAAGGLVSFLNFGIHALMTALVVVATRHTASRTDDLHAFSRLIALLSVTMLVLMIAHVMEIAVWAAFYGLTGLPIQETGPRSFPAAFRVRIRELHRARLWRRGGRRRLAADRPDHRAERPAADRLVGRDHLRGDAARRCLREIRAENAPVDGATAGAANSANEPKDSRGNHAENHRHLRPYRRGERLRRAGARQRAGSAGPRHHQPRYRPAGFPHARVHRRGGDQGAARRPPRLHAGDRHPAAARSGRRRPAQALQGRVSPDLRDDHAGRQAHHVHVDPDVRRAGRGHPLSGPRISRSIAR